MRAIIFNRTRDQILVEKSLGAVGQYVNFIGGEIDMGESFEACLKREMSEETNAQIVRMSYLFVVENFISFQGQIAHGLEHYIEVQLDREQIESQEPANDYVWIPVAQLREVDLRPIEVRNCIIDGTYRRIRHLISRGV